MTKQKDGRIQTRRKIKIIQERTIVFNHISNKMNYQNKERKYKRKQTIESVLDAKM